MDTCRGIAGVLLAVVLASGCGPEEPAGGGSDRPASTVDPVDPVGPGRPATLDNPLGAGPLDLGTDESGVLDTAALGFRDALFAELRAAGGVRAVVTGGRFDVAVDLVPAAEPWIRGARRFAWSEDGVDLEQLQLPHGRVCVNRPAVRALRALGNSGMGWISGDARAPYSCSEPDSSVGSFVVYGMAGYDAVTRLGLLQGETSLRDLGTETDPDGTTTRHVRIDATEAGSSMRPRPTSYDLWVDGDLRLVRAEFSAFAEGDPPNGATFEYGQVPDIEVPAAADRGTLVLHPGVGPGALHPPG